MKVVTGITLNFWGKSCFWAGLLASHLVFLTATDLAAQEGGRGEGRDRGGWGGGEGGGRGGWGGGEGGGRGGWGGGGGEGGGRRGFDPSSFLRRMDANGDGILDPAETSDRTKRFMEGMGVDPNQKVELDKLVKQMNGESTEETTATAASATASVERKVPGFGSDVPNAKLPPTFGNVATTANGKPGTAGGGTAAGGESGGEFKEQVDMTMTRYDKNKDGRIDAEEMQSIRWSTPNAQEADTNRDGILTRDEIAARYRKREEGTVEVSSESSRGERSDRGERSSGDENGRTNSRDRGSSGESTRERSANDSSERESSRSAGRTSSSGGSGNDAEKNRRYAEGMISQYDKDGDKQLNAEEMKAIRRPPANADRDKDGMVTVSELETALAETSSTSPVRSDSGSSTSESGSERRSFRNSRSGEPASTRSRSNMSFFDLDTNQDKHIQMYEFSEQWNDQVFEEFRNLDLNKDGLITLEEFEKSKGRE